MQLGMKPAILEKQLDWAAKRLIEVHKIDIKTTPFLISDDDTALQPHVDLQVYSKERKIELYGFGEV